MIIAVDVETYEEKEGMLVPILNSQSFTLGAICYKYNIKDEKERKKVEFFVTSKGMSDRIFELIEQDRKRGKRTYIYGHNLQYDFYSIFKDYIKDDPYVRVGDKNFKYLCFYPFIAFFGKQGKGWKFEADAYFLDTMGFFRFGLKEMAEMIEMEKGELPQEIRGLDELKPYLKRDVEIVLEGVAKIRKVLTNMGFRPKRLLTAGNTAMTTFLTFCKREKLGGDFISNGRVIQGKYMKQIRPAFRGGRVEAFRVGRFENVVKLDCNSMYPYIMMNMEFPYLRMEECILGSDCRYCMDNIGVVQVTVKCPSIDLPYLPIRHMGITYYPQNCTLKGCWTTLEIREATKLGYEVLEYDWGVFYGKSRVNPFKPYMARLWKERVNAKTKAEKNVIKLLMNALYGKWGQYRAERDIRIIPRKEYEEYRKRGYYFIETSGEMYYVGREGEVKYSRNANPIISIWITACARDYLYKQMQKIPKGKLLYVATDSLIIEQKDLNNLDTCGVCVGEGLGQFKIEGKGSLTLLGENRYQLGKEIHIGGVPKRDMNLETLHGTKKIVSRKIIGIKDVFRNENLRNQVGTFRVSEISVTNNNKMDTKLPSFIDETIQKEYWKVEI